QFRLLSPVSPWLPYPPSPRLSFSPRGLIGGRHCRRKHGRPSREPPRHRPASRDAAEARQSRIEHPVADTPYDQLAGLVPRRRRAEPGLSAGTAQKAPSASQEASQVLERSPGPPSKTFLCLFPKRLLPRWRSTPTWPARAQNLIAPPVGHSCQSNAS